MNDDIWKKDENASCKPERGLYVKILSYLSKRGINTECDISHLFNKSYVEPTSLEEVMLQYRNELIAAFLDAMESENHIGYRNLTTKIKSGTVEWVNPIIFKAKITPKGSEYYKQQTKKLEKIAIFISIGGVIITCLIGMCNIHHTQQSQNQQSELDSLKAKILRMERPIRTLINVKTKNR